MAIKNRNKASTVLMSKDDAVYCCQYLFCDRIANLPTVLVNAYSQDEQFIQKERNKNPHFSLL